MYELDGTRAAGDLGERAEVQNHRGVSPPARSQPHTSGLRGAALNSEHLAGRRPSLSATESSSSL